MRKLALLLGSLLVVASASAKEVVPAPVVVEEAPVQVIEKEVIVYRDKEEGFRPNGFVDLQYRVYGETEGQDKVGGDNWNKNNNYGRLQLEGKINMTENQSFNYRLRTYDSLNSDQSWDKNDQLRLRYNMNHGNLGDSNINFTSRVQYIKDGSHALRYEARFDFADYMFNNNFIKTTEMVVAPYYEYTWNRDGVDASGDNYDNELGLYANFVNELPYGFGLQVELDTLGFHNYGDKLHGVDDGKKKSDTNTDVAVNVYLTYGANLYSNEKISVDFFAESGYDSYTWSDKVAENKDHAGYNLKTDPQVTLTYSATPSFKVYATVGAEYRNWVNTSESGASNWRWQPFGIVGFRSTF
ncbi:membrane protein [Fusobacterium varium]|nr:membrane protein [Fusobacterium varium]